jgi:proteic killer suppression protein
VEGRAQVLSSVSIIGPALAGPVDPAFAELPVRSHPPDIRKRALAKLQQLAAAMSLEDLRVPPSNRLESLAGDREGQHSIRINKQWRLCFVFGKDGAEDVEISKHYE